MRARLAALAVLVFASPAFAQAIDSGGAAELTDNLARYIGKPAFDSGMVKVAVDGDAYRIDFDFKAITTLFPALTQHAKFDVAPFALRVRPNADSTWQVEGGIMPDGWFEMGQGETFMRMQWAVKEGRQSGIYYPAIAGFSSSTGSFAGIEVISKSPGGDSATRYGAGSISISGAKSAKGDGVDFTSRQTLNDYSVTQTIAAPGAAMKVPISMKAAKVSADANGAGVQAPELLELLAFAVAHMDPEKATQDQATLKTLLLAALPLWEKIDGTYAIENLEITTPAGIVKAAVMDSTISGTGVRDDARVDYRFGIKDMKVTSFLVPIWALKLIPDQVDLNFGATEIDIDMPARKVIEAFDLMKTPPVPDAVGEELLAHFAANTPRVIINKSRIGNAELDVVAEGEMTFPDKKAVLDMTISSGGYDKALETITTAAVSDPNAAEVLQGLQFARQLAAPMPDGRLEWKLNVKADGSVTVNGTLVKPADAQ